MLTKNEITSLSLSPTKKDFVQIWNELLEVAGKLSERWDPTSTNESDPGIVILKALAGIADKLNYNIDKNTLEAFMPTAAQEDSMRKLCDMLGYNIKYYQSAVTDVTIRYYNPEPEDQEAEAMKSPGLLIPKFTVITNEDQDINYFTINEQSCYISAKDPIKTLPCMEGQIVKCESINESNIITANQISSNNRFYLPETHIAENGIFVYNVTADLSSPDTLTDGNIWTKVDNLNSQSLRSRVFKFGYDSYESRPYIEFPDDYSELFDEGLFIYYARTNGVNGNISPRTLTQLEKPNLAKWSDVAQESFSVENIFSATTGANIETIKQAYNNFKKTIGTFETLVTCRDYMNKIYSMVNSLNKPYVSNILVTDIRNDLNRAITICSCDDAGIFYKETSLKKRSTETPTKPVFDGSGWRLGSNEGISFTNKAAFIAGDYSSFKLGLPGEVTAGSEYWQITQIDPDTKAENTFTTTLPVKIYDKIESGIDHFDLVFYPFKSYSQIKNNVKNICDIYDASFTYSTTKLNDIKLRLESEDTKTIAHNIITPREGDLVSINNYLRLNANIATNTKITAEEGTFIIDNIKIALANAFNMRELDFGEEIPFDSIIEVIERADTRIKVASLNEPALYTTFSVIDKIEKGIPSVVEYAVASDWLSQSKAESIDKLQKTFNVDEAKKWYNKLAIRNVLAGRVPLFNYNDLFKTSFSEGAYLITDIITELPSDCKLLPPDEKNPQTIWVDGDTTYCGYYMGDTNPPIYKKTAPPNSDLNENFKQIGLKNNVITNIIANVEDSDGSSFQEEVNIKDIATVFEIKADDENKVTNIDLEAEEYIKFRAPNFSTVKTYPAYINYHLVLQDSNEILSNARSADASTLFELLNSDLDKWSASNPNINWQKVLDYFTEYDKNNLTKLKNSRALNQPISKFDTAASTGEDLCPSAENSTGQHIKGSDGKCTYCGTTILDPVQKGPIIIEINGSTSDSKQGDEELRKLLEQSGCIKLTNDYEIRDGEYYFKAQLSWDLSDANLVPEGDGPTNIAIELKLDSPFITDSSIIDSIEAEINDRLTEYQGMFNSDGSPVLPTECAWVVSFNFEGVPFTTATLSTWENFIKIKAFELFDFKPIVEKGTIFWRNFDEGYPKGKYILPDTSKLLALDMEHFNLVSNTTTNPLANVYIAKDLGKDTEPKVIENNTEYTLLDGEYLYIEYTPSTVSDDGTTQTLEAVKEKYGPGTIIRPSGFETGLKDSTVYRDEGNSAIKTVTFTDDAGSTSLDMFRFGASEQVEIRDYAAITLNKDSFNSTSSSNKIFIYKNFNDCPELQELTSTERTYMLKDGEYIFYTDSNKAELAYFTTGTLVTLKGNVTIPKFDLIDVFSIFDSGAIDEIPWQGISLSDSDEIIFKEYQYVTLGPEDTLVTLTLEGTDDTATIISDQWQSCKDVKYYIAGNSENPLNLPTINTNCKDDRWEVSSSLVLNASPSKAQVLRSDANNNLRTGIKLRGDGSGGQGDTEVILYPDENSTLAFKTNLNCDLGTDQIAINNIFNPSKVSNFELKLITEDGPVIVQTEPGKTIPYKNNNITDINNWPGVPIDSESTSETWNQVKLKDIRTKDVKIEDEQDFDYALRLPASLIPNTYGIFTIYLNYFSGLTDTKTWIELPPGWQAKKASSGEDNRDLFILNDPNASIEIKPDGTSKILLNPGINCICVKKTGRFFIKTNIEKDSTQGTLFFDNIKLVSAEPIVYIDKTTNSEGLSGKKNTITLNTQGLNLKQLGYFATSDVEGNILDEETLAELKASDISQTINSLKAQRQQIENNFSAVYKELIDFLPKISDTVVTEESIKKEKDNLLENYGVNESEWAKLAEIIADYRKLEDKFTAESTLLDLLTNNKNLNEIEQPLVSLLESFSSIEEAQKHLLELLTKLILDASNCVESFSDEEILEDFIDSQTTNEERIKAFPEVKNLTRKKIEDDYFKKISELSAGLDQIVNSEELNSLTNILNDLQETNNKAVRAKILTLVKQLSEQIETDDIDSITEGLTEAVLQPDYHQLGLGLTQLYNAISNKDLKSLAAEIELAANENNDEHLKYLLEELSNLIDSAEINKSFLLEEINTRTEEVQDIVSLTNEISELTETVNTLQAQVDGGSASTEEKNKLATATKNLEARRKDLEGYTATIIDSIKSLNDEVALFYDDRLSDVLAKLKDQLTQLENSSNILAALNELKTSEDSQVQAITMQISDAIIQRNKYLQGDRQGEETLPGLDQLESFISWENNLCKDFIKEAIISIWPVHIKLKLNSLLNKLYTVFETCISNYSLENCTLCQLDESHATLSEDCINQFFYRFTSVLQRTINTKAFIDLYNQLSAMILKYNQNCAYSKLIVDFIGKIPVNSKINTVINQIDNSEFISKLSSIIKNILNELSSEDLTPAKKQYYITMLKEELNNAKNLDKQLMEPIAELIAPTLLSTAGSIKKDPNKEELTPFEKGILDLKILLYEIKDKNTFTAFSDKVEAFYNTDSSIYTILNLKNMTKLKDDFSDLFENLSKSSEVETEVVFDSLFNTEIINKLETLGTIITIQKNVDDLIKYDYQNISLESLDELINGNSGEISEILEILYKKLVGYNENSSEENSGVAIKNIDEELKQKLINLKLEKQILADLQEFDIDRDFYYTAPIATSLAIEFNEDDEKLNTLRNPLLNYDINNISNSFVISKLDIDYLDRGLKIARSSRLN